MNSEFHENGVLTGAVDSLCLSCEVYLKIQDIPKHITDPSHQKTFQTTNYVEKYKGEHIRKVKSGYYCEICNVMIQTLAKISIHVKDDTHIANKNKTLLKRSDGGIIVFDDILIEINAWHGLADGSCLICEIDYSNEDDHKNDTTHMLNLIQSKLELNENVFVYRKIYDDSYNCLICNTIITKESKYIHSDSSEHKENYVKCQENKRKIDTENDDAKKSKIVGETVALKAGDNVSSDKKNSKENGKTSESSTSINQDTLINNNTDVMSDDDETVLSPSEALAKAMEFAKANNLKYKRNNTYCESCDTKFSSTLQRMKEHVAGKSHRAIAKNIKPKEKPEEKSKQNSNEVEKLTKVPMAVFINTAMGIQNVFYYGVVINDEYCMNMMSFLMISINDGMARCQACETNINLIDLDEHTRTTRHKYAMQVTPVLTDFKTEFIREIRPNVYHCGYCNFIEFGLDQMKNHLKTEDHYERKSTEQKYLHEYLKDDIDEDRDHRLMMASFFNHLTKR